MSESMPKSKNGATETGSVLGQPYPRGLTARLACDFSQAAALVSPVGPLAMLAAWAIALMPAQAASLIDHHQHLASPQALSVFSFPEAITGADLVGQMDAAGIDRAVVLSDAYGFSNPFKNSGPDEYARVRAENDWVSMQVARYPGRLTGFCAVNPLRDYALHEIE